MYLAIEGNLGFPQQALELVGDLGRAFYLFDLRRRATGEDMGINTTSDFQGAFVAFIELLAENPKTPRFGGAKISSLSS